MLLCQLKYLSVFIVFCSLIHCHTSLFQRRDKGEVQKSCSAESRSGRCGPEYTNKDHTNENNDEYDEDHLSNSFFYFLNKTGETVIVSYSRGSENIKKSIKHNQCVFFHINDLRFLELTPSRCSWNCRKDYVGCRYCPTDPGFYVMNLESFPDDIPPSMYSGFKKTSRKQGRSLCSTI